jgi:hypothetical protein
VHGVEALVVSAVARRDWATAARHARIGQGRLIRLLALVARGIAARRCRGVSCGPAGCWRPLRRTTFPLVRALARRDAVGAGARPALPATSVTACMRATSPCWKRRRARRRSAPTRCSRSRRLWQGAIDDAALAALRARALELGIRDGAARVLALRDQVLGELALLLARADGELARAPAHAFGERWRAGRASCSSRAIRDALGGLDADAVGPALASAGGVGALADVAGGVGARGAASGSRRAGGALAEHGARQPVELLLRAVAPARRARGVGGVRDVRLAGRSRRIRRRSGRVLANRENARIALASLR